MKILLKILFVFLFVMSLVLPSKAIDFAEGYEQTAKKPMILLLYANWAPNYKAHIDVVKKLEKEYGEKYNIVMLDIAKPEAAAFNAKFQIYPNLPYILMYRDGGKISRYVQRNCAIDYSCVESRIKTFLY